MNEYLAKCPSFLLEYLVTWEVGFVGEDPHWVQFNLVKKGKRARVRYYYTGGGYTYLTCIEIDGDNVWALTDSEGLLRWLK